MDPESAQSAWKETRRRAFRGEIRKPNLLLLRDPNLRVVFGVTLISVLGVASITPLFPTISAEFGISARQVGLLITAFTLPGVILPPFLGVAADRLGRKAVVVPALFLFAIAGTACAFTRDFRLLVALRFLQGMGAAPLSAMNVTLIGDLYKGNDRVDALGYNASILSIGTTLYPSLGGPSACLGGMPPSPCPCWRSLWGWPPLKSWKYRPFRPPGCR